MLFSLEVLEAKHGDCLLLHYGTVQNPKIILIDGGPDGVYNGVLKPRLLIIKDAISETKPLKLEMVMVSHADDDHINGIVELTDNMLKNETVGKPQDFQIDDMWFNAFDDIIGNKEIPIEVSYSSTGEAKIANTINGDFLDGVDEHTIAVIASVDQGRNIRDNTRELGIHMNSPYTAMQPGNSVLVRGDTEFSIVDFEGLKITVLHPNEQRLQELQKKWDQELKKLETKGDKKIAFATLTSLDKSPFNLSSIVCLVEFGGKKILFTGDGRSDDILDGLAQNNLLDANGKFHVDVLKIPHHGSVANMRPNLLKQVTADHYVISADGKHDNPDQALLDMFRLNVSKGTLHLTNRTGKKGLQKKLDAFLKALSSTGHQLQVKFRAEDKSSMILNLHSESVSY